MKGYRPKFDEPIFHRPIGGTEEEVAFLRRSNQVPESQTCPRWVECPCRHSKKERGLDSSHCGAVQHTFGQGVYCGSCGALL